jgi:hypothetical protein
VCASDEASGALQGEDHLIEPKVMIEAKQGLSSRAVEALRHCFRVAHQLLAEGMLWPDVSEGHVEKALHLLQQSSERGTA